MGFAAAWRPGMLPLVSALLLLSGSAGLIYQVAWVRLLGLSFGVTIFAISTVLAAFMGGLAVGSVLGGRLADRTSRPLRLYGVIEVAIGLVALATPAAFGALQEVYRQVALVADPAQAPLTAGLTRGLLAAGLLLIPTALMGTTLPLAVRGVRLSGGADGQTGRDSRAMGVLYAANTTGAILGCLAAGFLLLGQHGIRTTIGVAAACNLGAGVVGLLLSAAIGEGSRGKSSTPGRTEAPAAEATESIAVSPRLARAAFLAFGISGAVSLAYEVVWSRVLAILFDTSIYGFVLMLATVLAGIALGSAAAGALIRQRTSASTVGMAFGWVEAGIGIGAVFSLVMFGAAYDLLLMLRESSLPLFSRLLRTETRIMAALCIVTVLPAALLMGASFPLAARLWAEGAGARLGRRLGGVYAANVAGAIVGSTVAGFVLVPLLGAHASLLLLAVANVAVGAWLLWVVRAEDRTNRTARPMAAAVVVLGTVAVALGATRPPVHEQVFRQRFADHQLLWYREGLENTVSVARGEEGELRMYTNSRSQTSDSPDLVRYHRVMGHLAALLSPRDERRVLVIGIGGGATPGAIARHSGTRLDLVELSEAVIAAAPFFELVSNRVLSQPNVRLSVDDGRNWLLRNRQPYDIITADIVPPYDAGANNLYSVEYFRLAARALASDGLMVQWVTTENSVAHELITRTFLEAFPHTTLWLNGDLLIGSPTPPRVNVEQLTRNLADPAARASLIEVGFEKPEDVLFHFRADAAELRAYVGDAGPILTDDRPRLEYFQSLEMDWTPPDLARFSGDLRRIQR